VDGDRVRRGGDGTADPADAVSARDRAARRFGPQPRVCRVHMVASAASGSSQSIASSAGCVRRDLVPDRTGPDRTGPESDVDDRRTRGHRKHEGPDRSPRLLPRTPAFSTRCFGFAGAAKVVVVAAKADVRPAPASSSRPGRLSLQLIDYIANQMCDFKRANNIPHGGDPPGHDTSARRRLGPTRFRGIVDPVR